MFLTDPSPEELMAVSPASMSAEELSGWVLAMDQLRSRMEAALLALGSVSGTPDRPGP